MATLNVGMKVNRAISGATTVIAGAYAMVSYYVSSSGAANQDPYAATTTQQLVRYFGPGQSIPASFAVTTVVGYTRNAGFGPVTASVTYTLLSGVEIINTI